MRGRFYWILGLSVGLAGVLHAETKPQEPYAVRPSSPTIKQREAVLALSQSKDATQAGPGLLKALESKDTMSRALAVRGLGNLKYAPARARLTELLKSDSDDEVREAAAVALRQIGDPQAAPALANALSDTSANVRVTALAGIARFGDRAAVPQVEAACKDKSVDVRRSAVYVLGRLEDPKSVPVVMDLLKDPDAGVRAGAAQALGELRAVSAKSALQGLLKDPDASVQVSAARSLAMMGDNSGLQTAIALVKNPDLGVRILAIDTLGWSTDPAAESALKALATSAPANTQVAVQEALTRNQQLRKKT